jgi:mycothiol synthase
MDTATRTTFTQRPYTDDDLQAVCDLLNICDAVDQLDDNYSATDLALEFESPEINKAKDLRIWQDAGGRVVGFGQMWIPKDDGKLVDASIYWRIHPETRNQGIEEQIFAFGEARAREIGSERNQPMRLRSWTRDFDSYGRGTMEAHGFEAVRYFYKMDRPLSDPIPEPQFPEGYTMRHANDSDEDAERWVDMFNQSFIDHWNHHPLNVESHKHWMTSPKYRPEGNLIAIAPDGTFAAFCFCWIDPEDNERNNRNEGWIDILGTRRGHRKIGLGRAMLLEGFKYLKSQGIETAKLGVDAENPTGALRLYESVGFKTAQTSLAYHKDL